ncbi:thiol-disulfide oxidoreductase DCC family protein [Undibacterium terreum]|uniref:Thiol-disulfide oxidoreductase DCC n=1 Tax=Undibacterium terreum TaxID=1224302 RepID=A0A916UCV5_9BURK|nr:DUF393 domain-containing protein [Undibacterium terreum]GGC68359.1 hypothetical protein GCM10011396_14230 [Undibacterium terreum]
MNPPLLSLYFDGNCPFCAAEMKRLRHWDTHARLGFIDIADPAFDASEQGLDLHAMNLQLHGRLANGDILVGLDTMLAAYTLAGKLWVVLPLRIKALRPLLSMLYRQFALKRYAFSRLMGYKQVPDCAEDVCRSRHPFLGN